MVERNGILEAEASRVLVVFGALDHLIAETRHEDAGIEGYRVLHDVERFGDVELLDRLPGSGASRLGGMNEASRVSGGERGGDAERYPLSLVTGDVQL